MQPLANFRDFERFITRFTNYERVVHFHYNRKTLGPDRMRSLDEALEHPHHAFPSVHIAGTKGKGSTSLILESLLAAAGYHVGTYTSPHVEHLLERIRVDEAPAGETLILSEMNRLLPYLESCKADRSRRFPTFFELMTALAMATFRSEKVDWGIFEVGLGGRLDATNILEPRLTAITSIGLEHTRHLGNTLRSIAWEKAGIIKPRTPVVVGPLPQEAAQAVREVATELAADIECVQSDYVSPAGEQRILIEGMGKPLPAGPIRGPALRTDLAMAYRLFSSIMEESDRHADEAVVKKALERLRLPARVELFPGNPPIVVDGAHTRESIRALAQTLEEIGFPRPRTLVFSIATDKEWAGVLKEIVTLAEDYILTCADSVRSVPPADLLEALGKGMVIEEPEHAIEEAIRREMPVVVTGSFYLAGRLRSIAEKVAGS